MIGDLLRFAMYWEGQRQGGNQDYPEQLQRGDWDEQFSLFCPVASSEAQPEERWCYGERQPFTLEELGGDAWQTGCPCCCGN